MRYMIHASPPRLWYVENFLIPSMTAQGIRRGDITVWNDRDGLGNLLSCMESFRACGQSPGGTWHLQDDVLICRDFAARTEAHEGDGIVCGFCCPNFGPVPDMTGSVPPKFMWWSFQCIRIPNELAGECAAWFFDEAIHLSAYRIKVAERKHDDAFWRDFLLERHPEQRALNLAPHLVEHIDWLIGGTLLNRRRTHDTNRAADFRDGDLTEALAAAIKTR